MIHFWHRYVVIIFATLIVVCAVYLQAKMINIIHHLPIQSKYRHHRDRIWCRAPAIAQATITKVIRYIRHGMIREDVRNTWCIGIFSGHFTDGSYDDMSYFNTNIRTVQSQIGIFKKSDCSSKCSWFSMRLQIVNINDLGLDILYDFAPDWNGGKYSKQRYLLKYDDIWFCRKVLPIPLKKNPCTYYHYHQGKGTFMPKFTVFTSKGGVYHLRFLCIPLKSSNLVKKPKSCVYVCLAVHGHVMVVA